MACLIVGNRATREVQLCNNKVGTRFTLRVAVPMLSAPARAHLECQVDGMLASRFRAAAITHAISCSVWSFTSSFQCQMCHNRLNR